MRFPKLLTFLLLTACPLLTPVRASDGAGTGPTEISVPDMRTSIYVGSVTLALTPLQRSGSRWTATYAARVFPWAFWNEHGDFTLDVPERDVARLLAGETVEFTGEGRNHKGKYRRVTGRAQPGDAETGRIKVRISVDDVELVFDGDYRLSGDTATAATR